MVWTAAGGACDHHRQKGASMGGEAWRAHVTAGGKECSRGRATMQTMDARAGQPAIAGPATGRFVHDFTLPAADGRMVRLGDYRQRANLVLFFHHGQGCGECRAYLREIAERSALLGQEEAVALAIGPDDPAGARRLAGELSGPAGGRLLLLCDPGGGAAAREGLAPAAVVVADRSREIWAAWPGGEGHALPSLQEIVDWLEFIELQCPECGAPEWPAATG
jgi:peroxiredoxin